MWLLCRLPSVHLLRGPFQGQTKLLYPFNPISFALIGSFLSTLQPMATLAFALTRFAFGVCELGLHFHPEEGYVPPEYPWTSTILEGVTFQNIVILAITAARTPNRTNDKNLCYSYHDLRGYLVKWFCSWAAWTGSPHSFFVTCGRHRKMILVTGWTIHSTNWTVTAWVTRSGMMTHTSASRTRNTDFASTVKRVQNNR